MKLSILGSRKAVAQERIALASSTLLARMDLPAELRESLIMRINRPDTKTRNPEEARMFQLEAIADFLDVLINPAGAVERAIRDELVDSNRLESNPDPDSAVIVQDQETGQIQPETARLKSITVEQARVLIANDITAFDDFYLLERDELVELGLDDETIDKVFEEIETLRESDDHAAMPDLLEPFTARHPDEPSESERMAGVSVSELDLPQPVKDTLIENGLTTLGKLAAATDDELLGIAGIGQARLKSVRTAVTIHNESRKSDDTDQPVG